MAPDRTRPHVIDIGYVQPRTRDLADLFRSSGYTAVRGDDGRLADSVELARRTGDAPFAAYADRDLLTDLESLGSTFRPDRFGGLEHALLRRQLPDAYLVLTTCDPDDWIAWRARLRGGDVVRRSAARDALSVDEVLARWAAAYAAHVAGVSERLKDDERFVVCDLDGDGLSRLAQAVRADYDLEVGALRAEPRAPAPSSPTPERRTAGRRGHRSATFVQEVVEFATRSDPTVARGMRPARHSRIFARWEGGTEVVDRYGQPAPYAVDPADPRWPFLVHARDLKHQRTEGVLNQVWQLGGRRGALVDMQDARRYGTAETGAPERPVLTYCRVQGAANLVLWPLPGYHTPGEPDHPDQLCADELTWRRKQDRAVWRGNLSGRALPELGAAGAGGERGVDLADALGGDGDARLEAALLTVPRYRIASRLRDDDRFDVGLVLGHQNRRLLQQPAIARVLAPRLDYETLYRSRYLLSVSGNDTGSNFLRAVDSRSVVLKEQDGWELYYSGQFRAWEHYVPFARGGDDLEEALDWARSHPRQVRAMSRAARHVVRRLVDPDNRDAYLRGILEVYESRL